MNSLKHGLIGDEEEIQYVLDIKISALKTERGYAISIDDNGCGIEYTKSKKQNTRMESSGNDLAQNLIKVFNNFEGEEYLIVFSENQVFDKKHDLNDGKGTKVILQFIRKNIG
jgi:two-component sensor histidine kinase